MFLGVQKVRIFFGSLHFSYIFPFPGTRKPGLRVVFIFISGGWCKWVKKYINRFYDFLFWVTRMVEIAYVKDHMTQAQRSCCAPRFLLLQVFSASGLLQAQWLPAPTIAGGPHFLPWSLFRFHIWSLFFLLPGMYSFFGPTLPKATAINSGQNKNYLQALESKQKQADIGKRRQGKSLGKFLIF